MMDLPALRVYWAKHRSLGRPTPDVDWEDLDVLIAALDALDALLVVSPADLEAFALSTQSIIRHAEGKDTEIRALQARIDAATVLIRRAMEERRMTFHPTGGIDTCENCRPYREWLGNKEAGNE